MKTIKLIPNNCGGKKCGSNWAGATIMRPLNLPVKLAA
jgi:hypothetical protein